MSNDVFSHFDDLYVPQPQFGEAPVVKKQKRPRRNAAWVEGKFLSGPIPLAWLTRASALPGSALAIGLAIWFLSGLNCGRKQKLNLTTTAVKHFCVSRSAKSRAIAELEGAGLIEVERRARKNPIVTILDVEAVKPKAEETGTASPPT